VASKQYDSEFAVLRLIRATVVTKSAARVALLVYYVRRTICGLNGLFNTTGTSLASSFQRHLEATSGRHPQEQMVLFGDYEWIAGIPHVDGTVPTALLRAVDFSKPTPPTATNRGSLPHLRWYAP